MSASVPLSIDLCPRRWIVVTVATWRVVGVHQHATDDLLLFVRLSPQQLIASQNARLVKETSRGPGGTWCELAFRKGGGGEAVELGEDAV